MAAKTRTISTLIESQLPSFITNDYTQFSKFVEKYYEQLEIKGQPLDIINNIIKYRDINTYENDLLQQNTILSSSITSSNTSISVSSTDSFPDKNGYIRIGDEICFYKEKTDTTFLEVSRGVSGNTTLGDLYKESSFVTTQASDHYQGDVVYNVSNLFLYALVKSFENQYLGAFPEKYLKESVDKRTLIKNIGKFYKSKGTERSIKFIFNSIISNDVTEEVAVYNPKDFTIKGSTSDWTTVYAIKVKVLSGDINKMIGNQIVQSLDDYDKTIPFASAVVDNVIFTGESDGDDIYELILQPSSVNGSFEVFAKTTLRSNVSSLATTGDRINVYSTQGWKKQGKLLIGNEVITFNQKNVNQFIIDTRSNPQNHNINKTVYSFSTLSGKHDTGTVNLIAVGIVYNLLPKNAKPYSESGDFVQISDSGFSTRDPIIFNKFNNEVRWKVNDTALKATSTYSLINNQINDLIADVSAVYEDDQYYYICSSSFPSYANLLNNTVTSSLEDQKILRLIRKRPIITTEVYSTGNRDVGILIDGSPAFSYRDQEYIKFGKIVESNITFKGNGYKAAPFVLINNEPNKARSILSGETVDSLIIDTDEIFEDDPVVTITSGRGARLSAVVTNGKITSITVDNPGEYYSSPPIIRITDSLGKGNFAEYEAVLSPDGRIESCRSINNGRFYTRETTTVTVESVGFGAQATVSIKKWIKNRYTKISNLVDTNNGYAFVNYNPTKNYGYGVVGNPKLLRYRVNDNITAGFDQTNTLAHSPILGYAYDGNPIYGPYGYTDPIDASSGISRLSSGYQIKGSRTGGPLVSTYPLGTFIDDYEWIPSVNSGKTELDPNNGRFCVTPDYPKGVYAYFVTIDSDNDPVFPYILGQNFYSLPVDSNYNSNISQDDIPENVKRLRTGYNENNGEKLYTYIQDVKSGNVSSFTIEDSSPNFSVNNSLAIDNNFTEGFGANAIVSSVSGKDVVSIESNQTKAVQITITSNAYLFSGDVIQQRDSDGEVVAAGTLIGDVFNDKSFVLRDCEFGIDNTTQSFNDLDLLFSETKVINVVLDKNASFTKGSIVTLTDGLDNEDSNIATGEVLEGTTRQNSLKIKVIPLTGYENDFIINDDYFLKSSNLNDTPKAKLLNIVSLSENLEIFDIDSNIAIVNTEEPHQLAINDKINIDITPDDETTETEYFVRKRLYQSAILSDVNHSSVIVDTGIGNFTYLNTGLDYQSGTYTNVELIFQDQTLARNNIGRPGDPYNARATVVITPGIFGGVQSITFTNKGRNYKRGDILTITDADLLRSNGSTNNQRVLIEVDHSGLGYQNTEIQLDNVRNISNNDYLLIGEEIVKITNVDVTSKKVTVERAQKNTIPINHYDGKEVTLFEGNYRFDTGYRPFGESQSKPYFISYNETGKEIFVSYEYGVQSPITLLLSSTFYDNSTPAKLVSIRSVSDPEFQLEFSRDNTTFVTNPIIDVQKYYKYKFDTSHFSMLGTYLDFSASSNFNIFTEEKYTNNIAPGNTGSFLSVKFGFGPNISLNSYEDKLPLSYSAYFYFIKASNNVNTKNSYLRIIEDPLVGEKKITYTTDTRFVYSLNEIPAYDGSGTIKYTTSSENAVGKIRNIKILDSGSSYKKIPSVLGVVPTSSKKAQVDIVFDEIKKEITGVRVTNQGQDYSKPQLFITDGDGVGAKFDIVLLNGKIKNVKILDKGANYSYKPSAEIIETDVKIYLNSDNIGVPQNVKIIQNGVSFNNDNTTLPSFKSNTTLVLKNINTKQFSEGETVFQSTSGAKAIVAKNGWRPGSNLLKIEKIQGIFVTGESLIGLSSKNTAVISDQIFTEFAPTIQSSYDNIGFYASDRGKLSTNSQKLTDSYFYQDYSYVIKSKTPVDVWRDLIKQTTHPAGFQLFGEVLIESNGTSTMPTEQKVIETYRCITLPPVSLTVVSTKKQVTTATLSVNSLIVERGLGSISVDTFDSSELFAREIGLLAEFNGDFSEDTSKADGDKVFTMYDKKTNLPIAVSDPHNLIISLDGVVQHPGEAFVVSGTQISFSTPPLGDRIIEGQLVESQNFYGRLVRFKNATLNDRYFKPLKDISSQFNGVDTTFDLYYTDGSDVQTDPSENLLVFLNGVLQKSKVDSDTPYGNSYYILRSEGDTDKIVFSRPPINPVETEDLPEKCFIYTIGSYERLTIDSEVIQYRGAGPYLIKNEVSNRVRKIDDSSFAFVFIDGVLQEENKSYEIIGPNITFTAPLQKYISEDGFETYQNVSIILLYGRDLPKTLTVYDFETDVFYNKVNLQISGTNLINNFDLMASLYTGNDYDFYLQNVKVLQNDILLGELKKVDKNSDGLDLVLLTPANILNSISFDDPLVFRINDEFDYTLSGTYSISSFYETNNDGERILVKGKKQPLWLYGYSLGDEIESYRSKKHFVSLSPGDLIQIDGEKSYREILDVPETVKPKNYNDDEIIVNDLYSKITVTNYNEITRGEGLSINAIIDENGTVIDLIWNRRDLQLLFERNVLLQPTAYQYYTTPIIEFIPQTEEGGGARAEVISYGGDILDIVLIDGGSGYTESPKVVVARGYNRIKSNYRKIDSVSSFAINPLIYLAENPIVSTSIAILANGLQPVSSQIISYGASFNEVDIQRQITSIVEPIQKTAAVSYASIGITSVVLSDMVQKSSTSISPEISPNITVTVRPELQSTTVASVSKEVDRYYVLGLFDYKPSEDLDDRYGLANAGFNIGLFDNNAFTGSGSSNVSNLTLEEFEYWYPNVTIEEFETRKLSHYMAEGEIFDIVPPSVQEFGTYLDAPLSETTTVVYVTSTVGFPNTGFLLINKELVQYSGKQSDRFTGLTRGFLNTGGMSHLAGDYIRSIELVDLPIDYFDPGPG